MNRLLRLRGLSQRGSPLRFHGISLQSTCGYHTYPDPNEKPQISSTLASNLEIKKNITNKATSEFLLDPKFRLDEIYPGVPVGKKIEDQPIYSTESTVLDNGLTIASQDMPGLMTSFAFVVSTGSSYENQEGANTNTGATQIMELAAFKSTKNRSQQSLLEEIEQLGGMIQCISTRESILYCVDVLRDNVEAALDILADSVLHAKYSEEEVTECKETALLMLNEMPSDMLSRDACQMAAYKGTPLGNHHFCPEEDIAKVNRGTILQFHKDFFVGNNCFISAAGIDHQEFVDLVKQKFGSLTKASDTSIQLKQRTPSKYIGGAVHNQRNLKEPYVKFTMGFEVGGWNHDEIVHVVVLNQLLGGGSSFSAGGPGKGMYTRLYREVLNQYHWVESIESFLSLNEELGIMGMDTSCAPEYVPHIIRVVVDQFVKLLVDEVSDEELIRAKNMAKSMMLMQLESRIVLCEDIARQYVTYGFRKDPEEICKAIDDTSKEDIWKLVERMLAVPPSVSAVGHDLSQVPQYEDIRKFTSMYVAEGKKVREAKKAK